MQWYQKYRPKKLAEVVGQEQAVKTVESLFARKEGFPHVTVIVGPYGCGKSTLAAIIAHMLGCRGQDLQVVNCATVDPMDKVREMEEMMHIGALQGKCRVWICEEVQSLSRAGFAQQGLLTPFEDKTNRTSYFILTTTDPKKINEALLSRCTKIELKPIKAEVLKELGKKILATEENVGESPSQETMNALALVANGSAREFLVELEKICGLHPDQHLDAVGGGGADKAGIDLCRALLAGKKWPEIAGVLKALTEDAEKVRRGVLGYANSVLLGGGGKAGQAALMIEAFAENYYDTGKVGLTKSCWDVVGGGR